ncbi:wall-associated receptor kinase 2-like [Triticum aestivum]|nr:wall-associated receptor kinase 2-like [Triticum aestivum]
MALSFLLPALLLAALPTIPIAGQTLKPSCQASCRGVDIPYPFGIGPGCFREGFEITCNDDGGGSPVLPLLANTTIKVVHLSIDTAELQVMLPIGFQCYSSRQDGAHVSSYGGLWGMHGDGVYRISNTRNMFVVLGCMTMGMASSRRIAEPGSGGPWTSLYGFHTGCMSYCNGPASMRDGVCAGVGCCHVDIPPGLTDGLFRFDDLNHSKVVDYSPCDFAFLVDKTNYTFRRSDLLKPIRDVVDWTVPVWLDWAIRDYGSVPAASCADAAKSTAAEYACKSSLGVCVMSSTNGTGYTCKCGNGYEGNAYLPEGCTDINECDFPDKYHCDGNCENIPGDYKCRCRPGYQSDDPKSIPCIPRFPLAAQVAIGTILSLSFLAIALLMTLLMLQKKRMREYFKKNGGLILKNVETLQIFTKEEINKITHNHSEFLGKGAFGEVYKGYLPDDAMVAVKSFIQVKETTMEEFTKEVLIQSKMIHKNILKLYGCCLEVDVPMLVYEFAAKGSLGDILHLNENQKLPIDLRLDIAIGSAEGLKYMHLYASQSIRHGDVKPDNILLDGELVPKISDFGLSKMLKVDEYFTKIVVGCMGYIDPVFIKTGLLTQKSDVYSFGVVLLELITRRKIVYDENCSLIMEFRKVYVKDKSGRAMFDKEIVTEEDILVVEEIGKLAIECLEEDVEDRPDMGEVAQRLVMLRRNKKHGKARPHPFQANQYDKWYGQQECTDLNGNDEAAFLFANP